jgi:integrase
MPSYNFWKVCCGHIERHLGSLPLEEVTRNTFGEYKALRKAEPIFRHGKPVEGSKVSGSTVNREITTLLGLLGHATEGGLLEKLPATKRLKESEGHVARERVLVLDAEEFAALLHASSRWLQRINIGANEACLSRSDVLKLTVRDVYRKAGMIKLAGGRSKTKMTQKVPISPALAEVLDELDRERRKLTSIHGADILFTNEGAGH